MEHLNLDAKWVSPMEVTHVVGEQDSNYVLAWKEMNVRPHMFKMEFTIDAKKFYKAIEKEFDINPENVVTKTELIYHPDTDEVVQMHTSFIKVNEGMFFSYTDTIMEPELVAAVDSERKPKRDIVDLAFYYFGNDANIKCVEKFSKKLVTFRVDRIEELATEEEELGGNGSASGSRKVGFI
jgi:hypothetical protein